MKESVTCVHTDEHISKVFEVTLKRDKFLFLIMKFLTKITSELMDRQAKRGSILSHELADKVMLLKESSIFLCSANWGTHGCKGENWR